MFWLIRKIFTLGILVALVFFALHFEVGGKPLKTYAVEIMHSGAFQTALQSAKNTVLGFIQKPDKTEGHDAPDTDTIKDDERLELEKVIKKQPKEK